MHSSITLDSEIDRIKINSIATSLKTQKPYVTSLTFDSVLNKFKDDSLLTLLFETIFSATPFLKSLNLKMTYLDDKFKLIVPYLPTSLVSLNLEQVFLTSASIQLTELFHLFPKTLCWLSLRNNRLNCLLEDAFSEMISKLPSTIKHLSLACNNLEKRLEDLLPLLPKNLTSLSLDYNLFYISVDKNPEDRISSNLTSLSLAGHNLTANFKRFNALISSLPQSITTLDIHRNQLRTFENNQLRSLFSSLPPQISSLKLGDNGFHDTDLSDLFFLLPCSITQLDLSGNPLINGLSSSSILKAGFKLFPPTLAMLTLANIINKAYPCNPAALYEQYCHLIKALPPALELLGLAEENSFFTNFFRHDLSTVLPQTVRMLDLSTLDNDFFLTLTEDVPSLPAIETLILREEVFSRMEAEKKILGILFPNLRTVRLLHWSGGERLADKHPAAQTNLLRSMGVSAEAPSLRRQTLFFITHSGKAIEKERLPQELAEELIPYKENY